MNTKAVSYLVPTEAWRIVRMIRGFAALSEPKDGSNSKQTILW